MLASFVSRTRRSQAPPATATRLVEYPDSDTEEASAAAQRSNENICGSKHPRLVEYSDSEEDNDMPAEAWRSGDVEKEAWLRTERNFLDVVDEANRCRAAASLDVDHHGNKALAAQFVITRPIWETLRSAIYILPHRGQFAGMAYNNTPYALVTYFVAMATRQKQDGGEEPLVAVCAEDDSLGREMEMEKAAPGSTGYRIPGGSYEPFPCACGYDGDE